MLKQLIDAQGNLIAAIERCNTRSANSPNKVAVIPLPEMQAAILTLLQEAIDRRQRGDD